jgi:hypothetical protein
LALQRLIEAILAKRFPVSASTTRPTPRSEGTDQFNYRATPGVIQEETSSVTAIITVQ